MALEPRRCHKCGRFMRFEMSYCSGSPVINWYCDWCPTSYSGESTISTNRTIYIDKDDKAYYVDTTNMSEVVWGGKKNDG